MRKLQKSAGRSLFVKSTGRLRSEEDNVDTAASYLVTRVCIKCAIHVYCAIYYLIVGCTYSFYFLIIPLMKFQNGDTKIRS